MFGTCVEHIIFCSCTQMEAKSFHLVLFVIAGHSWREMICFFWHFAKEQFLFFHHRHKNWFEKLFVLRNWLSVCAFSPRDLPVFCKWRDRLCLWSRLVVTRGDSLWSSSWMGKAWWRFWSVRWQSLHCLHVLFLIFMFCVPFPPCL